MADRQNLPRRYQDAEVSRILERATELQRETRPSKPPAGGLTLRELEAIAVEVGIDLECLRRAASELDARSAPASRWAWLTGRPATLILDRTYTGELPDGAFETVVAEIQRSTGEVGQPSVLGRTLTWRAQTPNNTRSLQVVVASRDGETRIRAEERLNQLAGAVFGGLMGGVGGGVGFGVGVGVGVGVLGSAAFALAFPPAVIATSYLAARGIFSGMADRRRFALHELIERIDEVVRDTLARRVLPDGAHEGGSSPDASDAPGPSRP
jgi:hypothetical protein